MGSELGVTADSKSEVNLSPVSVWWICYGCIWTFFVCLGIVYMVIHRNSPTIRIRGLGLMLSSIFFLHLYFWSVQFGLCLGNIMPGDAMFWFMGVWLPVGLSLFYASNARFLHIARLQKKYAYPCSRLPGDSSKFRRQSGLIGRFHRLDYSSKSFLVVGVLMFIQIGLSVLMYLISRKYHPSWGIPGTEVTGTPMEMKAKEGRGWEWWPGIMSQFVWCWIIAPITLWKARDIHDTQGWRTQTIACVIAGLPATPLWLAAIYADGMVYLQSVWLPPQWICVSILVIEIFTIFLPCFEVWKRQSLRQDTLDAIAQWEARNKSSGGENGEAKSLASGSTAVESILSAWKSTKGSVRSDASGESILTMGALEYVLERNPAPLQEFSALREFSGENIAFLTAVAEWKHSLPVALKDTTAIRDDKVQELMREPFNRALHIYAEYVSPGHAEFPVNVSHQVLRKLERIFEKPTLLLYGEREEPEPATPFKEAFDLDSPITPDTGDSEKGLKHSVREIRNLVQYWGDIPEEFDASIFDESEGSIKYLVLTNTWPKFIKIHRSSISSAATLEAGVNVVGLGDERSEKSART
ncbi:hypothetical protein N7478_006310 [Penicillium angulare]|uniref:uncharacterized protein n=1 Tax=Penicillium angulare TaxID=116970 RepID=UPI002541FC4E|nr:uncharacterized protein N7478_006310 [Penicillium angulare]KAJ5280938.1 hypothetical protein N7478_006310 [Penicillium angulare]